MTEDTIKLDLGCGPFRHEGWTPIDRTLGKEVYPLFFPDNSVEEVRASHILEHFGHKEVEAVLQEWVRVLKPGGRIRIAVPDFNYICKGYLEGRKEPFCSYLFGGQTDANDFHKTVFDEERLTWMMEDSGLVKIQRWASENGDCAGLPVSLNLEGIKVPRPPKRELPKIVAVMSMPRLAFSDNMFCALGVVANLGLPFERVTGVFWGQCMERIIEPHVHDDTEFILTVDYDSIFTADHVRILAGLMQDNPHIDALAPIQVKREDEAYLLGVLKDDGTAFPVGQPLQMDLFTKRDLTRAAWANFGLTLIRISALKKMGHPWFHSTPNKDGKWGEGRIDDDIYFWRRWIEAGNTLYLANRVAIGHAQLLFSWPSSDGGQVHQFPSEWNHGKSARGVWI